MIRVLLVTFLLSGTALAAGPPLKLEEGDHVAYIGNTMADRMQHHGWLETYLHAIHPKEDLTFRNLGFPGDELKTRTRSNNFGSPDSWLTKVQADVIFCFFGYNESLKGPNALPQFKNDLASTIDGMRAQQYNGRSAPRLVLFSPIAHENHNSPHLPDGVENNKNLELYTEAMKEVAADKNVTFVDLFHPTKEMYGVAAKPLTLNGIHLLPDGNKLVAQHVIRTLYPNAKINLTPVQIEQLNAVVLDKNYHWFSRYRVVDGYNVFGGRSKLSWFGQSNADVMNREMAIFDVKTANRDERVWAVAKGGDLVVKDNNLPEELVVKRNKIGPLEDGAFPYIDGTEAIKKMTIHKNMEVNLFADEKQFPRLINPVQMSVDADGRLWASVWPSYPHWNPTQPRKDALVILPDEDGDGKADELKVFADELNSVTGFEFWGGGVLVAAPPEIWFLKDTDGDDVADVKIRMLQGVSSADTHHSANAVLVGADGWMYWSRGIFNTASMETPTKTFRSTASGVHRFNPRTFEMEFHFPIGPNPHGDVFDQWGYQFASDGTSGTGSYINIGKGIGNKKWYTKRVRPVPATGILSSSHFPEEHQGNFLIANAIGVLGVLQHEVSYDGADITAKEIEPIVTSSDPNFRPSDMEIGGDGALYISDWHNALIGHMQHNMRDPNRDDTHGRIYRVTYKDRPLLKPVKLKGKPIAEVCQAFFSKENNTRYRARLELSGRTADEIRQQVSAFAANLDVKKAADAQALLECLWVFEEQRIVNLNLLQRVFQAAEPRVRAAAIRTLGHWAGRVENWQKTLTAAAQDPSALVRAEAVKAAVGFEGITPAEVIFEVATRPLDAELNVVLNYAKGRINVDSLVREAVQTGKPLSKAAQSYVLLNASVNDLLKMKPTEAVYEAILKRPNVPVGSLKTALNGLAEMQGKKPLTLLLGLIESRDANDQTASLSGLGQLLAEQPPADLKSGRDRIETLATKGKNSETRRLGFAAWIIADGSGQNALFAASKSKDSLRDLLSSIPTIKSGDVRGQLYKDVRALMFELPPNLDGEVAGGSLQQKGIFVEYYSPNPSNVAIETLEKLKPKASGVAPAISFDVPQRKTADAFALKFTGMIHAPRSGKYTFWTRTDDGSRLYIGKKEVVSNDGNHGPVEKGGSIDLPAGTHPIVVTYYDNGGGDALQVTWQGPGFKKGPIKPESLSISGGETLHDVAIRTLASIPGHEAEKFSDLARLFKAGKNRTAAVSVLKTIPKQHWDEKQVQPLINNLIGYLSSMPAQYRTGGPALEAIELTKTLSTALPTERGAAVRERLQNLNVRVIALGTVPARMIYDKERIAVQAGKPVEFRLTNTDHMPHNFAIVKPGSMQEIGELAEKTARDADAKARGYIPKSDKVLVASKLLDSGQSQALTYEAPTEPGVYPYVCTYPGHWRRMYGALYVVENLDEYQADPEAYLASHPLEIKDELLKYTARNTDWKFADLAESISPLPHGRSYEVGQNLFKIANCYSCHKIGKEGRELGPDLTKLDMKKHTTEHILRSILEPSKEIDKKFQSYVFVKDNGKTVTGMIVKETASEIHVLVDPLAKADPVVVKKDELDDQIPNRVSIMPKGLLDKLTEEEILDLIAFVYAKGDKKAKLYHMGHDH